MHVCRFFLSLSLSQFLCLCVYVWICESHDIIFTSIKIFSYCILLDPHTKFLNFCDDEHFPTSWKHEDNGFLAMEFKIFHNEIQDTQVHVLHQDVSVHQSNVLSDLLGDITSMDVVWRSN